MSYISELLSIPSRAITAAIEAVAGAKPKPRAPVIPKPVKVKAPKVHRPAVVSVGVDNLTLTNQNGATTRFNLGEKIVTEQKLGDALQALNQRFEDTDRLLDEVDRDLNQNDVTTNSLVEEVNELKRENDQQFKAIEGVMETSKALVSTIEQQGLGAKIPLKQGTDPLLLMGRAQQGGQAGLAMLLSGNGDFGDMPVVRKSDGSLVIDTMRLMAYIDVLGGMGLGFAGPTRELREARESGDLDKARLLGAQVAKELHGFVDASVVKAVEAALE